MYVLEKTILKFKQKQERHKIAKITLIESNARGTSFFAILKLYYRAIAAKNNGLIVV